MRLNITIFLISVYFLSGCSSNNTAIEKRNEVPKTVITSGNGPRIELNRSIVNAEVVSAEISKDRIISLEFKVLEIFDDGAYTSLAEKGKQYTCKINYVLNDNGTIDNTSEINNKLLELAALKPGDTIKLSIEMNNESVWLINDNLGK
jgi:hypothetical protein